MLEQPVLIFAVPAVGGSTRRLNVGDSIGLGAEHAEKRFRMHCPCPNFDIVGLLNHTSSIAPIFLQLKDEVLKCRAFYGFRFYFRFQRFHSLPFQKFFWRSISSQYGVPEYLMYNLRFLLWDPLEDFLSTIGPMFLSGPYVQLKVLL